MRFKDWSAADPPKLGDYACKQSGPGSADEDVYRRAYLVVGVEEGQTRRAAGELRTSYRLLMERVAWEELDDAVSVWGFYDVPRGA